MTHSIGKTNPLLPLFWTTLASSTRLCTGLYYYTFQILMNRRIKTRSPCSPVDIWSKSNSLSIQFHPTFSDFSVYFFFLLLFTATVSIGMTTEMRSRATKKVNARRRRIPWRPAPMATRFLCSGCGISLKLSTGSAISEKVSSFSPIQLRTHTHTDRHASSRSSIC